MTIPNLAGVVSQSDVFQKGSGNYAADYVSWARIANHLHTHAPGWEFQIRTAPDGGHVWRAPDGTGYVVTFFRGPEGQVTPDFPYPCQDNRNLPIAFEKVSCRTLTDTHRRALCANAAFAFSLGYELWAREEIAAGDGVVPAASTAAVPAAVKATGSKIAKRAPAGSTTVNPSAAAPAAAQAADGDALLSEAEFAELTAMATAAPPEALNRAKEAFRSHYNLGPNVPVHDYIKTQAAKAFFLAQLHAPAAVG